MKRSLMAGMSVVAAAMFVYSVHYLGVASFREALGRMGWGLAVILALAGVREAARAIAWTLALEDRAGLPLRDAVPARLVGESLNALLPLGLVVGEPAKAAHVAHRLPFATAFRALTIEFAFYGTSLLVLFGAAGAAVLSVPVLIAGVLLIAATFALVKPVRRPFRPLLDMARRHPSRVAAILALEVLYHALGVAEVYLTLWLISPSRPTVGAAVVLETVNRAVTIVFKILPMRVGVDEASTALAARGLALGSTTGVTIALVRKLRVLFWSAVGLGFMAVRAARQPARECAPFVADHLETSGNPAHHDGPRLAVGPA